MSYKITINGVEQEYPVHTTFLDIAKEHQFEYEEEILLAMFNYQLKELRKEVKKDGVLSFFTASDKAGMRTYRKSLTLLMQRAVYNLAKEDRVKNNVRVLFSIGQSYYCELSDQDQLTATYLCRLKQEMLRLVTERLPIRKTSIRTEEAVTLFRELGMTDKEKLFRYRRSSRVNLYSIGNYMDYHYGYMVPDTGYLKYFDLQLFEDGFVLMFPEKEPKSVGEFEPSLKLFNVFRESARWGEKLGVNTVGALNDAVSQGHAQEMILVQEALMEGRISEMAEAISKQPEKKFIMIAGPSSSGKTSFANRLSIQLIAKGMNPHPISLDNYYRNRTDTPLDEYGEYNYECLEALDVDLFNRNMTALLRGERVELPLYNFKTGLREYHRQYLQLGKHDILVIEGIHGLNDKLSHSLPKSSKLKIYVSALTQINVDEHNNLSSTDCRLLRRLVRDARTRNTTAEETLARWDSVRRGEEQYIFPYQEEADIMFNSALIYELAVLKQYAEPLLFRINKESLQYLEANRLLKFLDYFLPVPAEDIQKNSIMREFIGGSCFAAVQ